MTETETQRCLRAVTTLLEEIIDAVDIDADDTTITLRNGSTGKVYVELNAGEEIRKANAEISTFGEQQKTEPIIEPYDGWKVV